MKSRIEKLSELERRAVFSISAQQIVDAVRDRLALTAHRAGLPGFRPGRVTPAVIEQALGAQVRQEVIEEMLLAAFDELIEREHLRASTPPRFEWVPPGDAADDSPEPEFAAVFEVEPEFVPASVDRLRIERPVTEVDDAAVEQRLELIRYRYGRWQPTTEPAAPGTQVVFDLELRLAERLLRHVKRASMVLGAAHTQFEIDGIDTAWLTGKLIGMAAGQRIETRLDDNEPSHLPGIIRIDIQVKSVAVRALADMNDALARKLGARGDGEAGVRCWVREQMEAERELASRALIKQQILDALLQMNPIDVPQARIKVLFERRFATSRRRMQSAGFEPQDREIALILIEQEARKEAALSMIVSRIAKEQGLSDVGETAPKRAQAGAGHSVRPRTRARNGGLDERLEDAVVDWVLSQANVVDTPLPFEQLIESWKSKTA